MEIEPCQEIDLDFEAHDLIEDDQFSEAVSAENDSLGVDVNEQLPELHESTKPEQNQKNRRYNLRKSLAWDSTFFTSAGVLDPDELSNMITGQDKSEKPSLPRIQEEATGSTESLSTLASDNFTLEACEDDLFLDIRASIQRSRVLDPDELPCMINGEEKSEKTSLPAIQEEVKGSTESLSTLASDNLTLEACEDDLFLDIRASIQRSSKKATNLANSSTKKAATDVDSTAISSLKKEDFVPQDKNPKPDLKKTSTLQTVRMSRCQSKQIGKLGSGKSIKKDSVHSQVPYIAKPGETNSLLPKPPKTISGSIPSSTTMAKRESMGSSRVNSESGSSKLGTVSGKGTQPSKVPGLSGSRKPLPKSAMPLKCSLLVSSTTSSLQSMRSSISSGSSSNMSSGVPAKPAITMARRKLVKNGNIGIGLSGSIAKTPSRAVVKNRLPAPALSAYLMSTKISSSVSPASSISEWSSASSSSSSSTANQRSNNSRTSLDTSPFKPINGDNNLPDLRNQSTVPTAEENENGVTLTSNTSKKSSTQTGTFQAPAKPSGLRRPSPKISVFDGLKSPARTPNGHKQSVFSKNAVATSIPIQNSNSKLKCAKVPTASLATSVASIKPASPNASNASSLSRDVSDSCSLSVGVMVSAVRETCRKAEKVGVEDGVEQVVSAGIRAIEKDYLGDPSMYENLSSGDIKTVSVDQIGDNVLIKQDDPEKNCHSHPLCEVTEKDNDKSDLHKNVHRLTHEPQSETQDGSPSVPTAACRAPFSPINTLNSNECIDVMRKGSAIQIAAADKTDVWPSSEQKENI